jgi:hypothetical protein
MGIHYKIHWFQFQREQHKGKKRETYEMVVGSGLTLHEYDPKPLERKRTSKQEPFFVVGGDFIKN